MEFVAGLPPSDSNTTILTIVDRLSKVVHYIPLPKLPSVAETAELRVLSDCGPQFSTQLRKTFCQALGSSNSLSYGYHPQTNGQTERANQDLGAALWCVTSLNPASWSKVLPWVEYTHNSLTSSDWDVPA